MDRQIENKWIGRNEYTEVDSRQTEDNQVEIVKYLVEHNAVKLNRQKMNGQVDRQIKNKYTEVDSRQIGDGQVEIVKYLVEHMKQIDRKQINRQINNNQRGRQKVERQGIYRQTEIVK